MKVEVIYFLIGVFGGGLLGIISMAMMSANRMSRLDETIYDLKQQIRTNQYSKTKPRKYRKKS
jgi:hypothetical protein